MSKTYTVPGAGQPADWDAGDWDWTPDYPIEQLPEQCPKHDAPLVYQQAVLKHARHLSHTAYVCAVRCPECGNARPVVLYNTVEYRARWQTLAAEESAKRASELRALVTLCFYRHVRTNWRIYDQAAPNGAPDAFVHTIEQMRRDEWWPEGEEFPYPVTRRAGRMVYDLEAPGRAIVPSTTPLVNMLRRDVTTAERSGADVCHWKSVIGFKGKYAPGLGPVSALDYGAVHVAAPMGHVHLTGELLDEMRGRRPPEQFAQTLYMAKLAEEQMYAHALIQQALDADKALTNKHLNRRQWLDTWMWDGALLDAYTARRADPDLLLCSPRTQVHISALCAPGAQVTHIINTTTGKAVQLMPSAGCPDDALLFLSTTWPFPLEFDPDFKGQLPLSVHVDEEYWGEWVEGKPVVHVVGVPVNRYLGGTVLISGFTLGEEQPK